MTTTKKKAAVVTVAAVELTDVERDFLSHWTMFGPAAVVSKVGRFWTVWSGKVGFPLSKTKREAIGRADALALALGKRRRGL